MDKKTFIVLTIFFLTFSTSTLFASEFKIFFLDVGEGEAIYIESEEKKILIDTGNLITGHQVVSFLKKRNIHKLDALIITHPHPDHIGGVFHILQQIKIDILYDNAEPLEGHTEDIYRWYAEIFRSNPRYKVLKMGDRISISKDINLLTLNPQTLLNNWNENSLVFKLTHQNIHLLLMGDAGIQTEKILLKQNIYLKADLLKVGHHGSKYTTSAQFIEAVSPKYAVISINKNNIRGYPSPKTIHTLKEHNITLLSTFEHGDIVFKSDGKSLTKMPQYSH